MSAKLAVVGAVTAGLVAVGGVAFAVAWQPTQAPAPRTVEFVQPAADTSTIEPTVTPTVTPTVEPVVVPTTVAPAPVESTQAPVVVAPKQEVIVPKVVEPKPTQPAPYVMATGPNPAGPPQAPDAAYQKSLDSSGTPDAITPAPTPSP